MASSVSISYSGFKKGDVLVPNPRAKQNIGTSMLVLDGKYPCSQLYITETSSYEKIADILLDTASFSGMSKKEIISYLKANRTGDKELHIVDVPKIYVKVYSLGGDFVKKMSEEDINYVLGQDRISVKEIYDLIPPVGGVKSRAKHHTLLFRPNIWDISLKEDISTKYVGKIFVTDKMKIEKKYTVIDDSRIYNINLYDGNDFGVATTISAKNHSKKKLYKIASEICDDSKKNMKKIEKSLSWFTPSMFKSLLQKIIRTGTNIVVIDNSDYSADTVLLVTFILLYLHPGSFVPDIQTFVKGSESALKRLAVSIVEDSYIEDYNVILSLLCAAYLCKTEESYYPSLELFRTWMINAVSSRKDTRMYTYDTKASISTDYEHNKYGYSYAIICTLKSLKGDLSMFYTITGKIRKTNKFYRIESIPVERCLDHHTTTEIAYYFSEVRMDYPKLFNSLFSKLTGVNPRRGQIVDIDDEFVTDAISAQELLWIARSITPIDREYSNRDITISSVPDSSLCEESQGKDVITIFSELPDEWLAGIVGSIKVKVGKKNVNVCLRPSNIYDLIAVELPKEQNMKSDKDENMVPLTEKEIASAIESAKTILANGYKVEHKLKSMSFLFDGPITVYFKKSYKIKIGNKTRKWNTLKHISKTFPIVSDIEPDMLNSIMYTSDGIEDNYMDKIRNIILEYDIPIQIKLLSYLTNSRSSITMNDISRDGNGTYYSVTKEDTDVFELLSKISCIIPGIIHRKSSKSFSIIYYPIILEIRKLISNNTNSKNTKWTIFKDKKKRKLYDYQVETVDNMKDGKKGHIIWMKPGAGKTFIIFYYINYLITNGIMPKYFVYSTTKSAINDLCIHAKEFGIKCQVIDTTKIGNNLSPKPYIMNIIKHDHLKLGNIGDEIKAVADNTLLIVDEFHETLNPTKRTSIVLDLVRICNRFVAMSGTVIKDRNVKYLIPWLTQIVDFEVTEHNYYTAMSSMMSKRIDLNIVVNRHLVEAEFDDENLHEYDRLTSNMTRDTFRDAAKICFDVCTEKMLELTYEKYSNGDLIFLVARGKQEQDYMYEKLLKLGIKKSKIFLITGENSLSYKTGSDVDYRVIITTIYHSTGYTLTMCNVMITTVYFVGQHIREQLEGRLVRVGQENEVDIYTVHAGILTTILQNYNKVRNISNAFEFALG